MYNSNLIVLITALIQVPFGPIQAGNLLSYDPNLPEIADNSVSHQMLKQIYAQERPLLSQTNEYKEHQKTNSVVNLQDYHRLMRKPFSSGSNLMVSILRNFRDNQNVARVKREDGEVSSSASPAEGQNKNLDKKKNETAEQTKKNTGSTQPLNNGTETLEDKKRQTEMFIRKINSLSKNITSTIKNMKEKFDQIFKIFAVNVQKNLTVIN